MLWFEFTCLMCFCMWMSLFSRSEAEVFTAISDVEPLIETHQRIINDVNEYIAAEETRLSTLKKRLKLYKEEHEMAMADIPNYLANPINAFTLIKRLTKDLEKIRQLSQIGTENSNIIAKNHEDLKYPVLEDLTGAAEALTRLQETYELNVQDLSEGLLNGVVYSKPMSAGDCFEIGKTLYEEGDYNNSLAWMTEALRKYSEKDELSDFRVIDFYEYIALSHYYLGDTKSALHWTERIVELEPEHQHGPGNIILYQKIIAEKEAKKLNGEVEEDQTPKPPVFDDEYEKELQNYKPLCRGELQVPGVISKRLKCRYLTENHPFLKLAPIKMEYHYLQPDLIVFHDVMSDDEIEFIKATAQPRFRRAGTRSGENGASVPSKYRISKSAWLEDSESPVIARVSQRVADMTGLNMDTAEELQVVNYGIGGHYEPHYDFARKHENLINYRNAGNRIGTVLFYMSNVAQGGATVFTKLGVSLFPIKGAAAFWYNLHPSCEGDLATRHAACPVLRGSKWVSNKWIHQGGQELLRPCGLQYQEEGVSRRIPKPILKTSSPGCQVVLIPPQKGTNFTHIPKAN
ncbi:prolyl 4-hydroxylase subunit alpha-1-like [Ostrinia furnacalis]|uniref:prolyl 4-hydroxylase subunit alpha-1-like n=1 Tax=Ostrinia furnacalis TaxID=93504 RepID=UPI00103D6F27|nr:prolyl 4-hydroxylase subunit alpha-1-like [Ostrinia furnacalis]